MATEIDKSRFDSIPDSIDAFREQPRDHLLHLR